MIKDDLLKELQELQDQDLEDELIRIPTAPSNNLPVSANKSTIFFFLGKRSQVQFGLLVHVFPGNWIEKP